MDSDISQRSSHTQCHPQTKASQRVCLPSPEKDIFKNAPRAIEKEDKKNNIER